MAKEWPQFLQQPGDGYKSNTLKWQNASGAAMESCQQATSAHLRSRREFLNSSGHINGDDMQGFATMLPSHSANPNDLSVLTASTSDDRRMKQPSPIKLSPGLQQLPQTMDDHHRSIIEIMDSLPLQPQLKSVSPLSMSSCSGRTMQRLGMQGPIASSNDTTCPISPALASASSHMDCSSSDRLAATYNDLLSSTGLLSQNPNPMATPTTTTHKQPARYNDAIAVGNSCRSQNHGIAGADLKLTGSFDDILLGTRTGHNHVRSGANCDGYHHEAIAMNPDSKLSSTSWLACSAASSQELSPEEKEMIYRAAAMQPIDMSTLGSFSTETTAGAEKPKARRNVRISKDPQSIAARQRRQKISSKMRVLQKLVPGGMKMDTASMLEEAAHYLRFLKAEVEKMEAIEQLINVAKGQMQCRNIAGAGGQGPAAVLQNAPQSMKPRNKTMPQLLTQSVPQDSLLCNAPTSQYPPYLNQAPVTF